MSSTKPNDSKRLDQEIPLQLSRRRWLQLMSFAGGWAGVFWAGCAELPTTFSKHADLANEQTADHADLANEQPKDSQLALMKTSISVVVVTVDAQGNAIAREPRQKEVEVQQINDAVTLEMVTVPEGSFIMGSPPDEEGRSDEEGPQHEVTVQSFLMGRYPVTQAQWRAVAALPQVELGLEADPSDFKGDNHPVGRVSWNDAVEFCARLSRHTGRAYRLPSEAEWECACRAGTTTPFHFGETITSDLANYRGTVPYGSGPVGVYREGTTEVVFFEVANAYGLSDMHGNMWEWCADHWHRSYEGAPIDGTAWVTGGDRSSRVMRSGSWSNDPRYCRSAYRTFINPDHRFNDIGLRVVCGLAGI